MGQHSDDIDVLIGGFGELNNENSPGIEHFSWSVGPDGAANLERHGVLSDVPSPSWLERDGDMVYAILEDTHELAALRIVGRGDALRLTLVSRVPVQGTGPTHVAIAVDDRGAKHAITAQYADGSVSVFPVAADGSLGQATQVLAGEGRGPLPAQEGPHAHWILPLPDGRVLSTDLGADRIRVHQWRDGELVRVGAVPLAPGTGPRDMHLMPSADGSCYVAVVDEWGDTITLLDCSDTNGDIRVVQTIDLGGDAADQAASLAYVPWAELCDSADTADAAAADAPDTAHAATPERTAAPAAAAANAAAEDATSTASATSSTTHGGLAYIGLRGSERIVTLRWDGTAFSRLADVNEPGWKGRGVDCGGSRPRHLRTIGRYLIAANEVSDNLAIFRLNADGEPADPVTVPAGSPTTILPL